MKKIVNLNLQYFENLFQNIEMFNKDSINVLLKYV